ARAAHLVDRRRAGGVRKARGPRRLAGRRLPQAGGQHAAHDDLVDVRGSERASGHGRANRRRAELRSCDAREDPEHAAHRRACDGSDDDRIVGAHGMPPGYWLDGNSSLNTRGWTEASRLSTYARWVTRARGDGGPTRGPPARSRPPAAEANPRGRTRR